jgi:hypothetical protein
MTTHTPRCQNWILFFFRLLKSHDCDFYTITGVLKLLHGSFTPGIGPNPVCNAYCMLHISSNTGALLCTRGDYVRYTLYIGFGTFFGKWRALSSTLQSRAFSLLTVSRVPL